MVLDASIPYESLRGAHVVVGLSGGVDSSVSAALLKEQGLKVTALFMKNWEEDDTDTVCAAAADREDCQKVCDTLGIEFKTINFAAEYWDNVFEIFLSEYKAGRTPNPDILCNSEIKFKYFMEYALNDLKADFIATGHYCRRSFNQPEAHLMRGTDPNKDQSYFLHYIGQHVLNKVLFPVGDLLKPQVRAMASERHLITAKKKDSTGICFIGEKRFHEFLSRYIPASPGPILTVDGQEVGRHDGLMYATIGQRKGLNIGGIKDSSGEPWYVADKDFERNALIVVQGHDHPALYSAGLLAHAESFIVSTPQLPLHCTCKIRYRQPDVECTVSRADNNGLKVMFAHPVAAVAPGQSVVFYQDDDCLGGAVITAPLKA
ncbi:MAG: tRNA 2-thiouridine(34) synthase MnmA [Succinivibrio sp.]|nr:tRNA 2-thiouridine(34) synthase MnmA [Succinivibrio sp.]